MKLGFLLEEAQQQGLHNNSLTTTFCADTFSPAPLVSLGLQLPSYLLFVSLFVSLFVHAYNTTQRSLSQGREHNQQPSIPKYPSRITLPSSLRRLEGGEHHHSQVILPHSKNNLYPKTLLQARN